MTSIMQRIRAGWSAFWNPAGGEDPAYSDKRGDRYEWYWSLYWNTAYDQLARYLSFYPTGAKLYRYTRGLRNPVGRWVDFYVANIWGGILDLDAGDGKGQPSAIPILCEDETLRPAIAKIWQWSNWNTKRSLATLYSSALGDVFLKVVDRPKAKRTYIQVWWPGSFSEVAWDDFGYIKRAVIEYRTTDDRGQPYTYREEIEHPRIWGGQQTRFSTYKDGRLWGYSENGGQAQWEVPYDFVPLVHVPWRDVGQDWGAVGFAKAIRKIDAANALASQLADQVAKAVNTPMIAYGIQPGQMDVKPNQDGVPILYIPAVDQNTRVEPLLSDLNLADGLAILEAQIAEIGEDLPELRLSDALRSGMSGEALGRAFSDVMAQVQQVRGGHDSALVRAQQMAIAIAGQSGYAPVFHGFDLSSYAAGKLDHSIGSRPVLPRSHEEELAEAERRWAMVEKLIGTGEIPVETALREVMGWGDDKLREFGQQRLADIALAQEDTVTGVEQ